MNTVSSPTKEPWSFADRAVDAQPVETGRMTLIDRWFKDLRSIWEMRLEKLDTLMTETNNDDNERP